MKKFLTLLFLTCVFAYAAKSQVVVQFASDEVQELMDYLDNDAENGDIIELTTSGGLYQLSGVGAGYLAIEDSVTIRAQAGLAEKPILKKGTKVSADYHIRFKTDSSALVLQGIELRGDTATTKYAIRTAKIGEITAYTTYAELTTAGATEQFFNLTISDCDINGIDVGTDGRAIIIYPGATCGLLKIENTTFSAIERNALDAELTSTERATAPWNFADSMSFVNTTFYNIGRSAIMVRGENSDATIIDANKISINHCTFNNCGFVAADDSYKSIYTEYIPTFMLNTVFTNDINTKDDRLFSLRNDIASLDYLGLFNNAFDNVYMANGAQGSNVVTGDPLYADAANGDFTLGSGSAFLEQASDGFALGDLRWDASAVSSADLSAIFINDVALSEFDAATIAYNFELPYGTTENPVVSATEASLLANATITQSATTDGVASIEVTAYDGSVVTYTIDFNIALNSDSTLSDLTVGGTTIAGFASTTFSYAMVLDEGTTTVPTVDAVVTDVAGADYEVFPAATLPGQTIVEVTAEDGSSGTYSIDFTVSSSSDTTLQSLTVDGTSVDNFLPTTFAYTVELENGTTTVPTVVATPTNSSANAVVTPAASLPGTTTIVVTAGDDVSTGTYTVEFTLAPNSDATLQDLQVDGATVSGFNADVLIYDVVLANGTTTVPTVTASPTESTSNATVSPAATVSDTSFVLVVAEDGTELEYAVAFSVALNSDASLQDLQIDGATVEGFDAGVLDYTKVLAFGTTTVPTVTATTTATTSAAVVTPAASLPGTTTIVVTAEDESTSTYTIEFSVEAASNLYDLSAMDINIYSNNAVLHVDGVDAFVNGKVMVYNSLGKVLAVNAIDSDMVQVELAAKGIYIVMILDDSNNHVATQKALVK